MADTNYPLSAPSLLSSDESTLEPEVDPELELSSDMLSSLSEINRWDLLSPLVGAETFDLSEIVAFVSRAMSSLRDRSFSLTSTPTFESSLSLISIASFCFFLLLLHFITQLEGGGSWRASISFRCCVIFAWLHVNIFDGVGAIKIIQIFRVNK